MTLADPPPTTGEHPGGPHRHAAPFDRLADQVRHRYAADRSGHDMAHVWRVFRLGVRFAADLAADRTVVGCSALTHDLHRVVEPDGGCPPGETLSLVADVLERAGLDSAKISEVQHCVSVHDDLHFRGDDPHPETIEAEVLRDADHLDAMGAVGVARTFAFGGSHGTPLWDPDGERYSQLYHIEDKLLRLQSELHTEPAHDLAADRHAFLETFFDRFRAEWHGRA